MQSGILHSGGPLTFLQLDPFQSNVDAELNIGLAIILRAAIFVGKLGNKLE